MTREIFLAVFITIASLANIPVQSFITQTNETGSFWWFGGFEIKLFTQE